MLRTFHRTGLAAVATLALATGALADWPERPVDLIVAFGAGGGTDTLARVLAEHLSAEIGQPVVVNNKPGAGGTLGAAYAAGSDPDGYHLYMMATGHAVGAAVYAELPYDPVSDFAGVAQIVEIPFVFVTRPDFAADTLDDLIAMAKENPGDLTFASVGVGSAQHFSAELMTETTGIDMLHIPYQRTPEALAALLSGEVDMLVEVVAPMIGQIQGGDIKALAVTTNDRHPNLPDVATVAESGYDFDVAGWNAVSFPVGTPADIVEAANAAFGAVLAKEEVQARLLELGYVVKLSSPAEFDAFLASEVARWNGVSDSVGIERR